MGVGGGGLAVEGRLDAIQYGLQMLIRTLRLQLLKNPTRSAKLELVPVDVGGGRRDGRERERSGCGHLRLDGY